MITTQNILFELSRSLANALPEANDNSIDIPSQIIPIITLIAPIDAPVLFANTTPQRSSWFNGVGVTSIGPGVAVSQLIATLTKGLWRFDTQMVSSTNFLGTAAALPGQINLVYPNTGLVILHAAGASGSAGSPVQTTSQRITDILIPVDGVTMRMENAATLAGQTFSGFASIIATKLL